MRNIYLSAMPIVLATVSGMLAVDLYLPAIPDLPRLLGGTAAQAQYSLGAFMATFALGQLVFGVLADRLNRRKVLSCALTGLVVASLLCAMTQTMEQLIALRAVQGFAASAGAALAPALLREMADGVAVIRLMGVVSSVQAVVPALAPAIGAWMLRHWGWQWSFAGVAVIATVAAATFFFMPAPHRASLPPRHTHPLAGYAALLKSQRFLGYVVSHGFAFGGLITFIMAAPYVITTHIGGTVEDFALMQVILVACFAVSANLAVPVVKRIGADGTILCGSVLGVVGGMALLALTLMPGALSVPALAAGMVVVNIGHALRGGVGLARVMDVMPTHTGSASALMVFLAAAIGSIGTPVLAPFLPLGPAALGIAVAVQLIASLCVLPLALLAKPVTAEA
jgi:DHA1 family bicyclomycin/chloramphenicol resistance-like MFS transporter